MPSDRFSEIYDIYGPQVFRICMGYVNDRAEAQDLVQETFINIRRGLPTFRQEARLSTWIFRIATNNCLRHLERSKRLPTTELSPNITAIPVPEKDPKLAFLYKCISELEETDRVIISLLLEEVPQLEIAEIVGISLVNTRVKIHGIKAALAIKFKKHGEF